jgi:DtxR family manganese transport transcriptional regulator
LLRCARNDGATEDPHWFTRLPRLNPLLLLRTAGGPVSLPFRADDLTGVAVASPPSALRTDLPAEPTQALRFGKARTAQSGALSEDYVELISDLLANGGEARPTDIARRLGVSHATAIKTIGRLKREGLAMAKPYRGVFLTAAGEMLADRVRARHRVVVDLLLAVGVPVEAAEQDAEGIEHHVSDTSLAAFDRFLRRHG